MTTLAELIEYHRKKRDWFRYNKEHRQFHEDVLQLLEQLLTTSQSADKPS